jgi:hypothetical protein
MSYRRRKYRLTYPLILSLFIGLGARADFENLPLAPDVFRWEQARGYEVATQLFEAVWERCLAVGYTPGTSALKVPTPLIIETNVVLMGEATNTAVFTFGARSLLLTNVSPVFADVILTNHFGPFFYTDSGGHSGTGYPHLTYSFWETIDTKIDALIPHFVATNWWSGEDGAGNYTTRWFDNMNTNPAVTNYPTDYPYENFANLVATLDIGHLVYSNVNEWGHITGGEAYYTRNFKTNRTWALSQQSYAPASFYLAGWPEPDPYENATASVNQAYMYTGSGDFSFRSQSGLISLSAIPGSVASASLLGGPAGDPWQLDFLSGPISDIISAAGISDISGAETNGYYWFIDRDPVPPWESWYGDDVFDSKFYDETTRPFLHYYRGRVTSNSPALSVSVTITGRVYHSLLTNQTLVYTSETVVVDGISGTNDFKKVPLAGAWYDAEWYDVTGNYNSNDTVGVVWEGYQLYGDRPYFMQAEDINERVAVLSRLVHTTHSEWHWTNSTGRTNSNSREFTNHYSEVVATNFISHTNYGPTCAANVLWEADQPPNPNPASGNLDWYIEGDCDDQTGDFLPWNTFTGILDVVTAPRSDFANQAPSLDLYYSNDLSINFSVDFYGAWLTNEPGNFSCAAVGAPAGPHPYSGFYSNNWIYTNGSVQYDALQTQATIYIQSVIHDTNIFSELSHKAYWYGYSKDYTNGIFTTAVLPVDWFGSEVPHAASENDSPVIAPPVDDLDFGVITGTCTDVDSLADEVLNLAICEFVATNLIPLVALTNWKWIVYDVETNAQYANYPNIIKRNGFDLPAPTDAFTRSNINDWVGFFAGSGPGGSPDAHMNYELQKSVSSDLGVFTFTYGTTNWEFTVSDDHGTPNDVHDVSPTPYPGTLGTFYWDLTSGFNLALRNLNVVWTPPSAGDPKADPADDWSGYEIIYHSNLFPVVYYASPTNGLEDCPHDEDPTFLELADCKDCLTGPSTTNVTTYAVISNYNSHILETMWFPSNTHATVWTNYIITNSTALSAIATIAITNISWQREEWVWDPEVYIAHRKKNLYEDRQNVDTNLNFKRVVVPLDTLLDWSGGFNRK